MFFTEIACVAHFSLPGGRWLLMPLSDVLFFFSPIRLFQLLSRDAVLQGLFLTCLDPLSFATQNVLERTPSLSRLPFLLPQRFPRQFPDIIRMTSVLSLILCLLRNLPLSRRVSSPPPRIMVDLCRKPLPFVFSTDCLKPLPPLFPSICLSSHSTLPFLPSSLFFRFIPSSPFFSSLRFIPLLARAGRSF